jgi:hypothetical protein
LKLPIAGLPAKIVTRRVSFEVAHRRFSSKNGSPTRKRGRTHYRFFPRLRVGLPKCATSKRAPQVGPQLSRNKRMSRQLMGDSL